MALLAGGAARRESVTIDEVAHLGAGVSYLQKLDMRMNEEHPPLAKALAAVPLVVRGVHADYSHVSWTFSAGLFKQFFGEWVFGHWVIARWNDPIATVFWARLPMLFLTLVLGIVLFAYGSRLGDPWGGLLCLCAYATMPVMLAFGPLVLTDMAITLFAVLTVWAFASMWRSPSRGTALRFGLALGGALLSKFSAGLLFFCFAAFILSLRWRPAPEQPADKAELRAWRRIRWWSLTKGILFGALVVYAVYFVLSWNEPTDSLSFLGHNAAALLLRRVLMPPWIYLRGLALFAITGKPPAFILGHSYPHGVWFYFPVLFLLKSPLAFLLLLLLALTVSLVAKLRLGATRSRTERAGVALASGVDLARGLHRSLHTEPNAVQHPPLLSSLGAAGAVAGATSAHAGVAAPLGLACRPRPRLAHRRIGTGVGGNSRAGVPLLSSFLELVERRPPRLCFGTIPISIGISLFPKSRTSYSSTV